jgi:hypothetical protein
MILSELAECPVPRRYGSRICIIINKSNSDILVGMMLIEAGIVPDIGAKEAFWLAQ